MNKRYKHIIFFDTEFISTRRKNQPIEISLVAYDIVDNKLKYDRSFSTYILLEKGTYLNKYVTAFTGIDNEVTAAIEAVCDKLCCEIAEQYSQYKLRPRFSPGYGDLSLYVQRDIVRILDTYRKIGLTLSDSLLMIPQKSVTAIVGLESKS